MTVYYVDATTPGSNTSAYDTWAKAALLINTIAAIDGAGDTIYVEAGHGETTSGAITWSFAGTLASPTKLWCASKSANPPTASATGGTITTTSATADINCNGNVHLYGLTIQIGSASGNINANINFNTAVLGYIIAESCALRILNTGSNSKINAGAGISYCYTVFKNTTVRFAASGQFVSTSTGATLIWKGGGVESGGTSPTNLISLSAGSNALLTGLDLSNASAGVNIFTGNANARGIIRDSRLPTGGSGWTGALISSTIASAGERYELYNCDSGATNYVAQIKDYFGTLTQDVSNYRIGGASDGTTNYSFKIVTTANASWPAKPFYSHEFAVWIDTTGSAKTITLNIVSSATLTDQDIWLEVLSLQSSSYPIGTFNTDNSFDMNSSNLLATATNQTTNSETWNSPPATPIYQQINLTTGTIGLKGYAICRVAVGKASATVWVDPKPVVT